MRSSRRPAVRRACRGALAPRCSTMNARSAAETAAMLFRRVPEPPPTRAPSMIARAAEHEERRAPAQRCHEPRDRRQSERGAQSRPGEIDALRQPAFGDGQPGVERPRARRIRARLAGTEQEPARRAATHNPTPVPVSAVNTDHSATTDASTTRGPKRSASSAGGRLKQRVAERKGRQHPAELRVVRPNSAVIGPLRRRDRDAVHVQEHGQREGDGNQR